MTAPESFRRLAMLALAFSTGSMGAHAADAPLAPSYRPQYHYSPPAHWMNDPNGMFYSSGEYHLFYQYNPRGEVWGPMHWGHAMSPDLLHWTTLPIAISPDALGMIFSGSAVEDSANTSGLGKFKTPPVVAIYTSHDEAAKQAGRADFERQSLAYSLDKGRTWTKYPGNPVLPNPGQRDFRDPKVSWFESERKWVMTLAAGDHVSFYSSSDLKSWRYESDFGGNSGAHGGVWECPDLVALPTAGEGKSRAVLLVSVNTGAPNGGSGTQYFVGDFDGHRFVPSLPRAVASWVDYGTDDYAGITWANLPNNRRVFLGWMSNWQYAQQVPSPGWRGAMTLPRDLTLKKAASGYELRSNPIPELKALRAASVALPAQRVAGTLELTRGLKASSGTLELELVIDTQAASVTMLSFANSSGEQTSFRINRALSRYELDRSRSGLVSFDPRFAALQTAPLTDTDETTLHVFLDHSSIEIFVNQGEVVMTAIEFPATPFTKVTLEADTPISLKDGTVYQLHSVR